MRYQSNLNNVLRALDSAEDRALTAVGEFVRGQSQMRSPVKTGAYRDSHDYKVDNEGRKVLVGNNMDYALWLEIGSSKRRGQHIIENSVMSNVHAIKALISEMMRL